MSTSAAIALAIGLLIGFAGLPTKTKTKEPVCEVEKARIDELQKRSADRDMLEDALLACYQLRREDLLNLEDIRWQMSVVIDTCPGRVRPPALPRP